MSHDPHHATVDPATLFTDEQWQEFRNEDFKAGSAVVMLMLAIFCIGVVLYTIVALTL